MQYQNEDFGWLITFVFFAPFLKAGEMVALTGGMYQGKRYIKKPNRFLVFRQYRYNLLCIFYLPHTKPHKYFQIHRGYLRSGIYASGYNRRQIGAETSNQL